jgi:hypothetical protein
MPDCQGVVSGGWERLAGTSRDLSVVYNKVKRDSIPCREMAEINKPRRL